MRWMPVSSEGQTGGSLLRRIRYCETIAGGELMDSYYLFLVSLLPNRAVPAP
jgi:hypothetical protein